MCLVSEQAFLSIILFTLKNQKPVFDSFLELRMVPTVQLVHHRYSILPVSLDLLKMEL